MLQKLPQRSSSSSHAAQLRRGWLGLFALFREGSGACLLALRFGAGDNAPSPLPLILKISKSRISIGANGEKKNRIGFPHAKHYT